MTPPPKPFITVVSGLPRSGTSLMMQMLDAGGVSALTDRLREADPDNPRGYFELEAVKNLKSDWSWLADAQGKAVKIIHMLLMNLPPAYEYRVLFMRRDLAEVVRSQAIMLERSGKRGAAMSPDKLAAIFQQQLATVNKWLAAQPNMRVEPIEYAALVRDPMAGARHVADFLGLDLDAAAMAATVDPALYRNR